MVRRFGVTLGSCGGHFGHMEVPLGHLGSLWGYFGPTLGALWGHFWVMQVALGDLEGTLSLLFACENVFGVLMVSSRVYEGQFSKTTHFPNEFK